MTTHFGGTGSIAPQLRKPKRGLWVDFVSWHEERAANGGIRYTIQGPLAAMIVHAHRDDLVNLTVFGANGVCFPQENVLLVQDHEPKPHAGSFCVWPAQ